MDCEPEEFLELARRYVNSPQTVSLSNQASPHESTAEVFRVWKARRLDVDIRELMLNSLRLASRSNVGLRPPQELTEYVMLQARQGKDNDSLMDEIAEIYLGPKSRQADFVKANYDPRRITHGSPNGRIHTFRALLRTLGSEPQLMLPVLLRGARVGLAGGLGLEVKINSTLFVGTDPKLAREQLAKTPFVKNLDQFRAYTSGKLVHPSGRQAALAPSTIWGQTLRQTVRKRSRVNQNIFDGVPETFGWKLLESRHGR